MENMPCLFSNMLWMNQMYKFLCDQCIYTLAVRLLLLLAGTKNQILPGYLLECEWSKQVSGSQWKWIWVGTVDSSKWLNSWAGGEETVCGVYAWSSLGPSLLSALVFLSVRKRRGGAGGWYHLSVQPGRGACAPGAMQQSVRYEAAIVPTFSTTYI